MARFALAESLRREGKGDLARGEAARALALLSGTPTSEEAAVRDLILRVWPELNGDR